MKFIFRIEILLSSQPPSLAREYRPSWNDATGIACFLRVRQEEDGVANESVRVLSLGFQVSIDSRGIS